MLNVTLIILLASVAWTDAQAPTHIRRDQVQNLADKLFYTLVDSFFDRALTFRNADLNYTTLGQPKHLVISSLPSLKPLGPLGVTPNHGSVSPRQVPTDAALTAPFGVRIDHPPKRPQALAAHAVRASALAERTYVMVKPDGVQRGMVGDVIKRFEQKGFQLKGLKIFQCPKDLAKEHYSELSDKPFFPDLVDYISSGPVACMVWEGKGVVAGARKIIGATDPLESNPATTRGDFAVEVGRNVIHGSDSPKNAEREIGLWFASGIGMADWKSAVEPWLREGVASAGSTKVSAKEASGQTVLPVSIRGAVMKTKAANLARSKAAYDRLSSGRATKLPVPPASIRGTVVKTKAANLAKSKAAYERLAETNPTTVPRKSPASPASPIGEAQVPVAEQKVPAAPVAGKKASTTPVAEKKVSRAEPGSVSKTDNADGSITFTFDR